MSAINPRHLLHLQYGYSLFTGKTNTSLYSKSSFWHLYTLTCEGNSLTFHVFIYFKNTSFDVLCVQWHYTMAGFERARKCSLQTNSKGHLYDPFPLSSSDFVKDKLAGNLVNSFFISKLNTLIISAKDFQMLSDDILEKKSNDGDWRMFAGNK